MRQIDSSMFSHIGYDAEAMTLTVRYKKTGDVWVYKHYTRGIPDEPPEMGWGKWFNANVRGKYDGEKVEEDDGPGFAAHSDLDSDDNWGEGPIDGNA